MSSFILDKKEFIKAAGIMCGIDEIKAEARKWVREIKRKSKKTNHNDK